MRILITGASSGMGRHAALELAKAGHEVFAAARRLGPLQELEREARGLHALELDVTKAESIAAAVKAIDQRTGGYGVDAVINNAGYGAMGPLEEISDQALRAQYDTNVFGLMAVTRAFLPAMRERGHGRIVNISSIGGRMPSPLMGAYSSTKYAVEALSDALRIELRPFGVKVVIIEPGAITTEFNALAAGSVPAPRGPYAGAIKRSEDVFATFAKNGVGPEHVTRAIFTALFSRNPSARYIRPWRTYLLLWLVNLLPTSWADALMAAQSGLTPDVLGRKTGALAGLVIALVASSALAGEGAWQKVNDVDGVTVERRERSGSQFEELRATSTAPVPPARFFSTTVV
jgi:short-subunit dehydrogenase